MATLRGFYEGVVENTEANADGRKTLAIDSNDLIWHAVEASVRLFDVLGELELAVLGSLSERRLLTWLSEAAPDNTGCVRADATDAEKDAALAAVVAAAASAAATHEVAEDFINAINDLLNQRN